MSIKKKLELAAKHPQYCLSKVVERSIANFDNVVETGEYLDDEGHRTICEETFEYNFGGGKRGYHFALNAYITDGLNINFSNIDKDNNNDGVALLRKFSEGESSMSFEFNNDKL